MDEIEDITGEENLEEVQGGEESSSNSQTQKNGSPSQYIVNIIESKLKARTIRFNIPSGKETQSEIAEGLGNIPFVWYNGIQIETKDIYNLLLTTTDGLPQLQISFTDTLNVMKDGAFPLDDTLISIFINPRTDILKPIHLDFKIINFSVNGLRYNITGILDVNSLYIKQFKSISNKTSFEALKSISSEIGMGFSSNLDNTNDKMTWISTGLRTIDFIDDIVDKSYKSDETFLVFYIDFFYNLTYVDLEKELSRNVSNELGISNNSLSEFGKIPNKESISSLYLTNDNSSENSNNYFGEYRIINNSTFVSLKEGYLTKVKYYNQLKKDLLVFDVDSITSKGDSSIILKGKPSDLTFFKQNINLIYKGKLDEDNMHPNYHYSSVQNERNIVDLQKIGLEIKMKSPNFNLYRFKKVFVFISNQSNTPSASIKNNRLSGEWLIVDISYKLESGKFSQIIKLVTRELNISPTEG